MENFNPRIDFVADENNALLYEITSGPDNLNTIRRNINDTVPNSNAYYTVSNWRILPYGTNDIMPEVIKKTVEDNSAAPGMFEKHSMLIWGNGPRLYVPKIETLNGEKTIYKDWVDDEEIVSWLGYWADDYIQKALTDYVYMKGTFSKISRNRAGRIGGTNKIAKLEHIELKESRLACHISSSELIPTHIVQTDFSFRYLDSMINLKAYPIFNPESPFDYPTTAFYSSQYTFGNKYYSIPAIYGSLEWLRRSSAIPYVFKHLSTNSINPKFHVESPQAFWDAQEERIKADCLKTGREYKYSMLERYIAKFMRDLLKVLSEDENVGKVWHTRKILEVQGTNVLEHGWKITPIDQKMKDFIESYIKIKEASDRAISVGMSLHPGLSSVSEAGKVNGGSEQLYAFQNFKNSGVDIPERIVFKAINMAIKANWPNKNIKLGFEQPMTQSLSNINPKDRPIPQ
jgi:hypothetical protein